MFKPTYITRALKNLELALYTNGKYNIVILCSCVCVCACTCYCAGNDEKAFGIGVS